MLRAMACLLSLLALMSGCGDPPLYPISGKITLGGKPYERLLVYFHPMDQKVTAFTMGVGETTKDGTLGMRSTAGNGLAKGKYRVSFHCNVFQGAPNETVGLDGGKGDDNNQKREVRDLVPSPYNSALESPVEFEVSASGNNVLEFDIPAR